MNPGICVTFMSIVTFLHFLTFVSENNVLMRSFRQEFNIYEGGLIHLNFRGLLGLGGGGVYTLLSGTF